jgi:predicted Zn-dependent protease
VERHAAAACRHAHAQRTACPMMLLQYIWEAASHEIGHTLGLK